MNFGAAIEAVKAGQRAARASWAAQNKFIYLNPGSVPANLVVEGEELINGVAADLFVVGDADTVVRMPNFCLRSVDGSTVNGWLASQTDMLAEDWVVLED